MAVVEPKIKQIALSDGEHDINAKYIQDGSGNPKTWTDIENLMEVGFDIKIVTKKPGSTDLPANETNYNTYKNSIVLYQDPDTPLSGTYGEWVITRSGSSGSYTYSWEKIGTTATDLSDYAKIGTYKTSAPDKDYTGSAGAQTATGTATVTYSKATGTGSAGGHTINGNSFTFTGTKANLIKPNGGSVKVDHHSYTPAGSITGSQSVSAHSHTVNCSTATAVTGVATGGSVTVLTGVKVTGTTNVNNDAIKAVSLTPSATSTDGPAYVQSVTGTFNTGAIKSISGIKNYGFASSIVNTNDASGFAQGVMTHPVVSSSGVLSWTCVAATTQDAHTGDAAGTASVSPTTKYMKVTTTAAGTTAVATAVGQNGTADVIKATGGLSTATFVTGATTSTAGAVTISGSNFGFSGTAATLKHTQSASATPDYNTLSASVATTTYEYTPAGSIGGSQTVDAHTHTVTLADATATGSASVSVANHTHSLSAHTHTVSITNTGPTA